MKEAIFRMGIGAVATDYYCNQSIHYGVNHVSEAETSFGDELTGSATSISQSSANGKRIGITTVGDRGYIAMYADSSTEEDPVVKVGKYEVHVKDVDPKHATRMEMFALLSYMDDKGLSNNHGISSFTKMKAYSSQAEYNGFVSGIEDDNLAWTEKFDWISTLNNAKETFLNITETYKQALEIDKIVFSLTQNRR